MVGSFVSLAFEIPRPIVSDTDRVLVIALIPIVTRSVPVVVTACLRPKATPLRRKSNSHTIVVAATPNRVTSASTRYLAGTAITRLLDATVTPSSCPAVTPAVTWTIVLIVVIVVAVALFCTYTSP